MDLWDFWLPRIQRVTPSQLIALTPRVPWTLTAYDQLLLKLMRIGG